MTSLKLVRKHRQQLHMRDMRGLVAFCFCPLEEKVVNKYELNDFRIINCLRKSEFVERISVSSVFEKSAEHAMLQYQ